MTSLKVGDYVCTPIGKIDVVCPTALRPKLRIERIERLAEKTAYGSNGLRLRLRDLREIASASKTMFIYWRIATQEEVREEASRKAEREEWLDLKSRLERIEANTELPLEVLRALIRTYENSGLAYAARRSYR